MEHFQYLGNRTEFVKEFGSFILNATKGTGILVGTLIAQAILESSGKEGSLWLVGGSKLSRKANNFFGIKCSSSWKGEKYEIETTEWNEKEQYYYTTKACFRKYRTVEDSIKDYIQFLQNNQRYKNAGVFQAKTVKTQAQALQKAGYATSPNYADLVNKVYLTVSKQISSIKQQNKTFGNFTYLIPFAILAVFLIFEE
jgi:mannosyl-glycoprotein endo-beta-N-acetylglucosaminidase/stage II sporulation protein P